MADEDEPTGKERPSRAKAKAAEPPADLPSETTEAGGDDDDGTAVVGALVPTGGGDGGGELTTVEAPPPADAVVLEGSVPTRRERNKLVLGRVYVHFPERDVEFVLDGDSAMRLIGDPRSA